MYHTLVPLFRYPSIPRCSRRAHSTRSPPVSRCHTTCYDRPSPRNSSRLRMSLQPAFFQRRSRQRPGLAPIIEYPVPCFGPRSPTHSQSLRSEHLDPIALTVAAATMMHSDVLGGRCSPTTAHAFRSGRRPSHEHRLRILSKFTMYIDSEIEISDMQK